MFVVEEEEKGKDKRKREKKTYEEGERQKSYKIDRFIERR